MIREGSIHLVLAQGDPTMESTDCLKVTRSSHTPLLELVSDS